MNTNYKSYRSDLEKKTLNRKLIEKGFRVVKSIPDGKLPVSLNEFLIALA